MMRTNILSSFASGFIGVLALGAIHGHLSSFDGARNVAAAPEATAQAGISNCEKFAKERGLKKEQICPKTPISLEK